MKSLIIGAAGFAGQYLIRELAKDETAEIHATKLETEKPAPSAAIFHDLDVRDGEAMRALLSRIQPDFVYHLAALSSVKQAWAHPELAVDINIGGAVHLLEAARGLPSKPRILMIGSGEEYGFSAEATHTLSEDVLPRPGNIYAVTKTAQNLLGVVYAKAYGIPVILVRAFNHIGPGQDAGFVASDFSKQIAMIEKGLLPPVIRVGNLSAKRDFCDVRDIVRAYRTLIEKGVPGETYNIGSGQAVSIQKVLDTLLRFTDKQISVEVDKERFRPIDVPCIQADIRKLSGLCGWKAEYPLEQSLLDMLNDWRGRMG